MNSWYTCTYILYTKSLLANTLSIFQKKKSNLIWIEDKNVCSMDHDILNVSKYSLSYINWICKVMHTY